MMASYVDEIVIEPETKTGYMVVNAGFFGATQEGSSGAERESQTPNDPPNEVGGSQVDGIAGARVPINLRPLGGVMRHFQWGGKAGRDHPPAGHAGPTSISSWAPREPGREEGENVLHGRRAAVIEVGRWAVREPGRQVVEDVLERDCAGAVEVGGT